MAALPYECETVREQLPEYAEGVLVGRALARVESHVSGCARCQKEVADLGVVIAAARSVAAEEVPDTLAPRVRRAVQQRAVGGGRMLWPRLAIPVAVLTGLVAVTFALHAPEQARYASSRKLAASEQQIARKATEGGEYVGTGGGEAKQAGGAAMRAMPAAPPAAAPLAPGGPRASAKQPLAGYAGGGPSEQGAASGSASTYGTAPAEPSPTPADGSAQSDHMAEKAQQEASRQTLAATEAAKAESAGAAGGAPPGSNGAPGRMWHGPSGGDSAFSRPRLRPGIPTARRGHYTRDQERGEAELPGGPGAASAGSLAQVGKPSVLARATMVKGAGQSMIALEVASAEPSDTITLKIANRPAQSYRWRSTGERPATIPVPPDAIGQGPAALPLEVTSSAGKHNYMLFVPVVSQLGKVAPSAPEARYRGASMEKVLGDLSRLSGLVILAEQPVSGQFTGEMPRGTPEAALRQLGREGGFEVEAQGSVYTLTRLR